MKKFDFEYTYALEHSSELFDGAIIRKRSCKERPSRNTDVTTTWYKVKIRDNIRIFVQIDESEVPCVKENLAGDLMLNLRTGSLSIYSGSNTISQTLAEGIQDEYNQLRIVRKWAGVK